VGRDDAVRRALSRHTWPSDKISGKIFILHKSGHGVTTTLLSSVAALARLIGTDHPVRLMDSDLSLLDSHLSEAPIATRSWPHAATPEFEIASAILTKAFAEDAYDPKCIAKVATLAVLANVPRSTIVAKVMASDKGHVIADLLRLDDRDLAWAVFQAFLNKPSKPLGEAIISSEQLSKCLNLETKPWQVVALLQ
jgi:hypothetical protein